MRQRGNTGEYACWPFRDLALLAATHRSPWTSPRPRVSARALTPCRHTAPVTESAIAPDVHQALDVHCDFSTQISLDPHFFVDNFTNAVDLVVRPIPHACIRVHIRALEKLLAGVQPDTKDVRQSRLDSLVAR
jgi:hypothetical protein